ncbi:hypothetical protein EVG20_g11191 [Dentipellis fragilis]|uniref:Uncharacterized protein n=1 Tax=Dentipellis fragilis TaxID=205917 RepID=A0A4Y9XLV3_9AGAM|nr:hypothetical protein EVG20_g11191 [Dentipellis fragilis]
MHLSRGRVPGEWTAYAFEVPLAGTDDAGVLDKNSNCSDFSLLGPEEGVEIPEPHALRLRLPLYPDTLGPDHAEARPSLAYRLLYADGHVHWLGSPGHDERAAPAEGDEPSAEVWVHREPREGDAQFAQIRQTGGWGRWTIGHRSVHHLPDSNVTNARYLLFVLRVNSTTAFAFHQALILFNAESGSLHLVPSGMLTCPPSSQIHVFRGCPIDGNHLHDDLEALGGLRWMGEQDGFMPIASPEGQLPVWMVPIPHLTRCFPS